ncbi:MULTISPECIES: IS110 family transposase [Mycobacteriaceae]|uniref:Transposase n=1 Tax=Mycobacterium gordonae TaxID=1778 RepID=A0A0Q2QIY7_MYCGO|nr:MULTISPECIES: IS110 family transposase [Mycobacteriaceae]KQH79837.1 transposase [Mycobacterium gordonae]MBN7334800.1 IS110 family transposase [Mycobacteroides abscessus subsp. abscessus]SIF85256.1 transposase IS116/IS110/IS902 family protein [Mycobacteroides abscessus subsp. abscessus]SIH01076.1 transposase IS116/IS110/IS902 family protein [Mycobacteroides abscessus subsp. abscessus]SIH07496.1 transposase IS116/IS110/IS902 family protein [Mycobacteroides abscessus subsp. abscessus]
MSVQTAPVTSSTIVVAVDVGKTSAMFSVTDAARHRLVGPSEFAMNRSGLAAAAARAIAAVPELSGVKVGVEAAGHYHRPVLDYRWPPGWEVLELNPAHVAEQRRVQGRRRVKTDVIDLEAITDLVLAGHGSPVPDHNKVIGEMSAWASHRHRRVATRTATKNQLLGQLDRAFPGLTLAIPDVLGTRIGRLVAAEFADPARLSALGVNRLIRFAATRDLQLRRPVAERLVSAARDALPTRDAVIARQILAADLNLLADLDDQIRSAETALTALLPRSPYATLTTVPGWGVVRVSNYAAALGDPARWPGPRQIYRAAGLSPMQYESAHKRRDGTISREGSVALRRALIDLGIGLWLTEPMAKTYAHRLKARGKHGGVVACALAHRATRIAYALMRDHTDYDGTRWT